MSKGTVENILVYLENNEYIFPQFGLVKLNNELKLLGGGGFSSVYEMYNKERPELSFALKVTGMEKHTVSSEEFWNTEKIQWILCQESKYIVRILDARELVIIFDGAGSILQVKDISKGELPEEISENTDFIRLQFVLMEKLEEILKKDRFQNVSMVNEKLGDEAEVIRFALEIGCGLQVAHNNHILHRDIKLENVFWDEEQQIYKLGDFGISKYAEEGNAETIVYTDGYGAPEIEKRLNDGYNATADIYSFGISMYLLLNDLRFPGSEGYYPKPEIQYHPNYIFPAPVHASVEMTRIIRKMCSYHAADRYQTMDEVMADLILINEKAVGKLSEELPEIADMVTETYREDKNSVDGKQEIADKIKTRAERKAEQILLEKGYRKDCIKYFFLLTVSFFLLIQGFQTGGDMTGNMLFWVIPVAVAIEAILQYLKDFYVIFGVITLAFSIVSMMKVGISVPHLLLVASILCISPVISLSAAAAVGLWIAIGNQITFFDYIRTYDMGWIAVIFTLLILHRFFHMRAEAEKITGLKAYIVAFLFDKISFVVFVSGIFLLIMEKCGVFTVPEIVKQMHLIRTGIICFIGMGILVWWDGMTEEMLLVGEEKKGVK